MSKIDDVVTVQVARVSRRKTGTDYSHEMDALSFRCATHQVRIGETTEFGPDGAQKDQYDDGGDWAPVRPDTLDAYVEPMVCEGNRSSQTWPSIKAFVDSGRGGAN